MSEVSNSAASLSILGTNPLLIERRKPQARTSAGRVASGQAPSVVLVRTIHQLNRTEDRTWAIVALAAFVLVAMSVWI